jgi:hypothetical protein
MSALDKCATMLGHHSGSVLCTDGAAMLKPTRWHAEVQTSHAKEHCNDRWSSVSSAAEQILHKACVVSPWRASRSAFQQHHRRANHTLKGAKECQTCAAPGSDVRSWKKGSISCPRREGAIVSPLPDKKVCALANGDTLDHVLEPEELDDNIHRELTSDISHPCRVVQTLLHGSTKLDPRSNQFDECRGDCVEH